MAKRVVKISLATKFRLLLGFAVLGIIATALIVPWYFMELLSEQGPERPGAELTRLRLNEWLRDHHNKSGSPSVVSSLYTTGGGLDGRGGPTMIRVAGDLSTNLPLDSCSSQALRAFVHEPDQDMAVIKTADRRNRDIYRCFRAVRIEQACLSCHGTSADPRMQFQPGQLVGIIDLAIPDTAAGGPLVWWTRWAFIVGVALAGLLAFILFSIITQRLVIRPVRYLRAITSKVSDGNLSVRSKLRTGDELEHLGESFNEMLSAIDKQHGQLKSANRALDLKLGELAEANVTLFQANKVKSEFIASISHELRTPLNSIIGFAELLGENTDDHISRYGRNISISAKNLMNMINDLLDLAKIEAGRIDVKIDKVSLDDTCRTLASLMKPIADKKQLDMAVTIGENLPIINTDAGKLQQILFNLLSNAIKFTPADGRVAISATVSSGNGKNKKPAEISVAVSDSGPGIAEADQESIFEKFYQADRSLTRESYGTGLGLAIARELTNLLGGRLILKSSPGSGAVFTLTLPIKFKKPRGTKKEK